MREREEIKKREMGVGFVWVRVIWDAFGSRSILFVRINSTAIRRFDSVFSGCGLKRSLSFRIRALALRSLSLLGSVPFPPLSLIARAEQQYRQMLWI